MKTFIFLLVLLLSKNILVFSQTASQSSKEKYRVVYSLSAIQTASASEAAAVIKVITKHIQEKLISSRVFETVVCQDQKMLIDELNKGYDQVILSTDEYYNYKKQYNLQPIIVNQTADGIGFSYLLTTNIKDTITALNSLKGSDISIQRHSSNKIPIMLIDKLLNDNKLPKRDIFFNSILEKSTVQSVVLPLLLGKVRAALFTEQAFNVLNSLNPNMKKQLKVIYRSPRIILGVTCINGNKAQTDMTMTKRVKDILTKLHENEYGNQLLKLFVTDKLVPITENELNKNFSFFNK